MKKLDILAQNIGIAVVSIFVARGMVWIITKTEIEYSRIGFAYLLVVLSFLFYFIMVSVLYE